MDTSGVRILAINGGSSSVKLTLFAGSDLHEKIFEGTIENIGQPTANLVLLGSGLDSETKSVMAPNHVHAVRILIEQLAQRDMNLTIAAIGHRIVHGGPEYSDARVIDDDLLHRLQKLVVLDPEHVPIEVQLIEELQKVFPAIPQVACFDTAFHHDLPRIAQLLPIPRVFTEKGVRRYGFHGLSYAFIVEELQRLESGDQATARVIVAHLGSGASLAAIKNGKPIDTTMAFTPASGVPMSTRSGDLDPGLGLYLAQTEGYDAKQFNDMVNFKSGLLGVSETSADMKLLLEREADDPRAKDAVDLFCYQVKKTIGAFTASLGGLDTLVFTGGMGENAPKIRATICEGLGFLGILLAADQNAQNKPVISSQESRVTARVIHADEARTIAQEVRKVIAL